MSTTTGRPGESLGPSGSPATDWTVAVTSELYVSTDSGCFQAPPPFIHGEWDLAIPADTGDCVRAIRPLTTVGDEAPPFLHGDCVLCVGDCARAISPLMTVGDVARWYGVCVFAITPLTKVGDEAPVLCIGDCVGGTTVGRCESTMLPPSARRPAVRAGVD